MRHLMHVLLAVLMTVNATAYVHGEGTALGTKAIAGHTVAVSRDLQHLLGRYIWVEGCGTLFCNDVMNKRFRKRIDIVAPNHRAANEWGIRSVRIAF